MSIITDLYTTLNDDAAVRAIVGQSTSPQQSKIYASHAADVDKPFITFDMIAGVPFSTIPGTDDMERQLIQIDCNETTPRLAEALADAVVAALAGNGYQQNRTNLYEDDTQTYIAIIDWAFMA